MMINNEDAEDYIFCHDMINKSLRLISNAKSKEGLDSLMPKIQSYESSIKSQKLKSHFQSCVGESFLKKKLYFEI